MSTESVTTRSTESGVPWVNATGIESFELDAEVDKVGRQLSNWINDTQGRRAGLANRAAYVVPDNPYKIMKIARAAVDNDDVVGGVCDVTESLMLQGMKWESEDPIAADIFNQMSRDLDFDELARQWHREDFTYSQAIIGLWWGAKDYTPRAKTPAGKTSKRKLRMAVPLAWTYLDPAKVVPLTPGPFGQDRLAWHATDDEWAAVTAMADGTLSDPVLQEFTAGPVTIKDKVEIDQLGKWGIDHKRLLLLNPAAVFRLCRTKMSYERFPTVRLKATFPILDLKQQLIEADRVSLVGAANYILLVRQGDKDKPATQTEIDNLEENFKVVAKLPVVVGDHRLSIDIVTPEQEFTLDSKKYDTLDQRILGSALGALAIKSGTSERGGSPVATRGIARTLEDRRHMMKRIFEREIARVICEHPMNRDFFEHEPNLVFTPKHVQLDNDGEIARSIMMLRTQNDLSRESTLEHFGFDQAAEAQRKEQEEEAYPDWVMNVPFSADGQGDEPAPVSGARGGRPAGGGASPKSPAGQSGARTGNGNRKT